MGFFLQEDFEGPVSDVEGDGVAVTSQPQSQPLPSTNPFVMQAPPSANENTSLNFQNQPTYTPGP